MLSVVVLSVVMLNVVAPLPLHALHAGCMACSVFQNVPAYFAAAVSYKRKMFMKLPPAPVHTKSVGITAVANFIKLFRCKLRCYWHFALSLDSGSMFTILHFLRNL
jgi:hypothetical protein